MEEYKIVIQQPESTVVAEYKKNTERQKEYQSEAELERAFIEQLKSQGYNYADIHNNIDLVNNLKIRLEKLNHYEFTKNEWNTILNDYIDNPNQGIVEKSKKLQEDFIYALKKDDGSTINIYLIDKKQIHNNYLQVINQYEVEGTRKNRYDVTILVNGLPLVHVELKRRGVSIKEAFNQIRRYERESFWADNGLFEFAQIFVISNGTDTKYYSNTTRELAQKENNNKNTNKKKTSNSFEFTSFWADEKNVNIYDVVDFTETFFQKHTLLNILTKYCIFTVDELLLVMRPYQIAATEKIVNQVNIGHNTKKFGSIDAGGYIWHTTGSGKTLTSFKAAQLSTGYDFIKKVLFVVDRKDLDYQTMKEYDKFQKDSANASTSTRALQKNLEAIGEKEKIVITTIQKLAIFVTKNPKHPIFNEEVVLIFDECHRSQFGDMHQQITKAFKKYYIFGFTGTPIFAENANGSNKFPTLKTTQQVFGRQLHTYTIVNAIHDKNVLPFRIDYLNTIKEKDDIDDKEEVYNIKREEALLAQERITENVNYILEHFNQKTKRNEKAYQFSRLVNIQDVAKATSQGKETIKEQKQSHYITGFNSIFAVASIEAAKLYYAEFKRQQESRTSDQKLKIATIYSWAANEEVDGTYEENNENVDNLDKSSRDFLESAIHDYNGYFGTNYDTSSDKFQNYYKDLSLRMKNKEVDLLIVVNMFLTGFDATTLNTIWVDKKLRMHGLIQAFSRTNRILNSIKTYGNVVCFRNLEYSVNKAISIFGDENASGIVLLKSYNEYYNGYDKFKGYKSLIEELLDEFPIDVDVISEKAQRAFISLFNQILKVRNILLSFDDFKGNEILSAFDYQGYQGLYLKIHEKLKNQAKGDPESIIEEIEFEIELIKSVEVNIDYILMLVQKMHENNSQDKTIEIHKAIDSSPGLRNKKDLILDFISSLTIDATVDDEWQTYIMKKKQDELEKIIKEENLKESETLAFMEQSFRIGEVKSSGTAVTKVMKPVSMFDSKGESRVEKKKRIIDRFIDFFNKFFGL